MRMHRVNNEFKKESETRPNYKTCKRLRGMAGAFVCVCEGQPDRMIDLHWLWFP